MDTFETQHDLTVPPEGVTSIDGVNVSYDADGNPIVTDPNEPSPIPADGAFFDNLAEAIDPQKLATAGSDVVSWVDYDLQSRAPWVKMYRRALELLGIKDVERTTLDIKGSSKVTHPLIALAAIEFNARARPELLPATGPVKTTILGKATVELEQRATRVAQYMNYQLTEADQLYYQDTDKLLFMLPLCGSVFKKVWYDEVAGIVKSRYRNPRDVIVPYEANDMLDAMRITDRYRMNEVDMKANMASGYFRTLELGDPVPFSEDEEIQELNDIADNREMVVAPDDKRYVIYECHAFYDFGDGLLPYIIIVEKDSQSVLAVYRNWDEADEKKTPLQWFVHYKFLPGPGFYGLGYIHTIGGLASAATGSLRALLDSAAAANFQGGFKTKNSAPGKMGSASLQFGVWQDVDLTYDDLSKSFYTPPFKEPSNALFQMFNKIEEMGRALTSTTEVLVGDASNQAPVGTTLALIEQATKPFVAVHARCHEAQKHEFRIIARLNYTYLPDQYPYDVEGDSRFIMREDFAPGVQIIPVSDPNIFSDVQRIAMRQASYQLAMQHPDILNLRVAVINLLKAMKTPDMEMLVRPEEGPPPMDPVSENAAILKGEPVQAHMFEADQAHVMIHMQLMEQAQAAQDPVMQKALQPVMAHIAEHYAQMAIKDASMLLGQQIPPVDQQTPEIANAIAMAVAGRMQQIQQPQPQQDPAMLLAMAEIQREDQKAVAEIERKQAESLAGMEAERARLELAAQAQQAQTMREDARLAATLQLQEMSTEGQQANAQVKTEVDATTKLATAEAKIQQGDKLTDAKVAATKKKANEKPKEKKSE